MDDLLAYDWPGNVRQLENAIERIVLFSRGSVVGRDDLPAVLHNERRDTPVGLFEDLPSLEEVERRYLEHVLKATGRNRTRAADILGIDRRTLYRMAERYGVKLDDGSETGVRRPRPVSNRGSATPCRRSCRPSAASDAAAPEIASSRVPPAGR
jgi:DNA-binding NtrC family response regulator